MSHRDTVIYEAEEVEAGRMSIYDCEYPDEVIDEMTSSDFDSEGYNIQHNMDWDNIDYNPQANNNQNSNQNNNDKTICGICCLLFIIFWFFSLITYHP